MYSVQGVSKIKSILSIIFHAIYGAACIQLTSFYYDWESMCTLRNYHQVWPIRHGLGLCYIYICIYIFLLEWVLSALLGLYNEIHQWPVDFSHKGSVVRNLSLLLARASFWTNSGAGYVIASISNPMGFRKRIMNPVSLICILQVGILIWLKHGNDFNVISAITPLALVLFCKPYLWPLGPNVHHQPVLK